MEYRWEAHEIGAGKNHSRSAGKRRATTEVLGGRLLLFDAVVSNFIGENMFKKKQQKK